MRTPLDNFHVLPINDLKEHEKTMDCWCNPEIQHDLPPYVIVHNAADRREEREVGHKRCYIPKV